MPYHTLSTPQENKETVTLYILDFDGCMTGKDSPDVKKTLESKRKVFEAIADHLIGTGCVNAGVLDGSNRQTKKVNNLNSKHYNTCSVFDYLAEVPQFLNTILQNKNSEVRISLEKILMTDIVHGKKEGESFDQVLKGEDAGDCKFDTQKFILLYTFLHFLAKKHEGKNLVIRFLDDTHEIYSGLKNIFGPYFDLLPDNIQSIEIIPHIYTENTLNTSKIEKIYPGKRSMIDTHITESLAALLHAAGESTDLTNGVVKGLISKLIDNNGAIIQKFLTQRAIREYQNIYPDEMEIYKKLLDQYEGNQRFLKGTLTLDALKTSQENIHSLQEKFMRSPNFESLKEIAPLAVTEFLDKDLTTYLNITMADETYTLLKNMLEITDNWGRCALNEKISELKKQLSDNPHLAKEIEFVKSQNHAIAKQYNLWLEIQQSFDLLSNYQQEAKKQINAKLENASEFLKDTLIHYEEKKKMWADFENTFDRIPSAFKTHTDIISMRSQLETALGVRFFPWCEKYNELEKQCKNNKIEKMAELINEFVSASSEDKEIASTYLKTASNNFLREKAEALFAKFFHTHQFSNSSPSAISVLLQNNNPLNSFYWADQLTVIESFSKEINMNDAAYKVLRLFFVEKAYEIAADLLTRNDKDELERFKRYIDIMKVRPFISFPRNHSTYQPTTSVTELNELEHLLEQHQKVACKIDQAESGGNVRKITIPELLKEQKKTTLVERVMFLHYAKKDLSGLPVNDAIQLLAPIKSVAVQFQKGNIILKVTSSSKRLQKAKVKNFFNQLADHQFNMVSIDQSSPTSWVTSSISQVLTFSPKESCKENAYQIFFERLKFLNFIGEKEAELFKNQLKEMSAQSLQEQTTPGCVLM